MAAQPPPPQQQQQQSPPRRFIFMTMTQQMNKGSQIIHRAIIVTDRPIAKETIVLDAAQFTYDVCNRAVAIWETRYRPYTPMGVSVRRELDMRTTASTSLTSLYSLSFVDTTRRGFFQRDGRFLRPRPNIPRGASMDEYYHQQRVPIAAAL